MAPFPLEPSRPSSRRRRNQEPQDDGSIAELASWERIVNVAPPKGPFGGWKGALEGRTSERKIGAARAVHYVVDPAIPHTGKLGRRLRKRLGLSVWKDFAEDLHQSQDMAQFRKGTWKRLEQEEKHLARELGCIEVLMGPILEASSADSPASGRRNRRRKFLGGFKVYCVPSVLALAGGFIDRLGDWWPLRDNTLRVWEQLEESGVELAELHSKPLTIETLFSEFPGLEDYDPVSSAAFAERLSNFVVASPFDFSARRAGDRQAEREARLSREVTEELRRQTLTPSVVTKVYSEVDRRLPRSGRHGLMPNLHTRNVYNIVADVIFAQAKADIEPYILQNTTVPRDLVEMYVRLRNVNKDLALNRTSSLRRAQIASRNLRKYNDARGPGRAVDRLIAAKGSLGAVLGSFATRGRDLLLWGNKAGDKIDTWRWLAETQTPVKSPWRVTDAQVKAFKGSELRRIFGDDPADGSP